jgi:hypothetical protein
MNQHHLIPLQVISNYSDFFDNFPSIGGSPSNFVGLPNNLPDAIASGDALHVGSHPAYSEFVDPIVDQIISNYYSALADPTTAAFAYTNSLQDVYKFSSRYCSASR